MLDFKERISQYSNKTDEEALQFLFHYWGLEYIGQSFKLIVSGYEKSNKLDKNGNEFGTFKEVRSLNGDILYYPFSLGLVGLFFPFKSTFLSNEYWLVDVKINTKANRDKFGNPFLLAIANNAFGKPNNRILDRFKKEQFIRTIFNARGATTSDARTISNAVLKLAGDNYTDLNERFVFELLQNADDMPKEGEVVSVKVSLLQNHIVIIHNGLPFRDIDIEAITDIGRSTKSNNPLQTGYKGIGFKIVFQESENVLIKSGGYSFSFDKNHPYYDSLKKNIYLGLNSDEIPWQLKPIWTENYRYDKEIRDIPEFNDTSDNVAIAIETNKIDQFRSDISYLLNDPRFILFLRNINSIEVNGIATPKTIVKSQKGNIISLTANNYDLSDWLTYEDIEVIISPEVKDAIKDDKTVPPKLKDVSSTKFNFVCQVIDDKIVSLEPESSYLFSYLPTNVNDYKFPFLVNADFLTTANRQSIHSKNKWNLFLFEQIGFYCIKWISEIITRNEYLNSVYNLLPQIDNNLNDLPWQSFMVGFNKALNEVEFVLSNDDELISIDDVIVDKTGLSKVVSTEIFKELIEVDGDLISEKIKDSKPLLQLINDRNKKSIISFERISNSILNEGFAKWLKVPSNNLKFITYVSSNNLHSHFKECKIYLANDFELYNSEEIYLNLGEDSDLLVWLNYEKILNSNIQESIGELQLPLNKYEPLSFIDQVLCKEYKKRIIDGLNGGDIIADDLYKYLSKYASDPLLPISSIKDFPLETNQGLISNWSNIIFNNSKTLELLNDKKSFPNDVFYLLGTNWNDENYPEYKVLSNKLGAKEFLKSDPYNFLKGIISDNREMIFNYYTTTLTENIDGNLHLWNFILNSFENLSPVHIEGLMSDFKLLPILSKNDTFHSISSLYISSEYTSDSSLEIIAKQFTNSNIQFVSAKYLGFNESDKIRLRKLFSQFGAKEDTKSFLKFTLIPNLSQLDLEFLVPLTSLIYDNRYDEDIIDLVVNNSNFKLKTKEGVFKSLNECLIGSPYIDESQIPDLLNFVPILNQVSSEYSIIQLDSWKRFFVEKLKIRQLVNESEILTLKLWHINQDYESWKNPDKNATLLKELYLLYKSGKLSVQGSNLNLLKLIPLLSNSEESKFLNPSSLHFSSVFNPIFDIEQIFGRNVGVPFLSDLYHFDNDSSLISFFEHLGVSQDFDKNILSPLIQNIPTLDQTSKPANQLFKFEHRKFVGPSFVSFKDLSVYTNNGYTLEDYFGFKSRLNVNSILKYLGTNKPNKGELKELISEFISVYYNGGYNDKILLSDFINSGSLLTTAKTYNLVKNLYSVDDSINSGISESEYIIDTLFNKQEQANKAKYLQLFNVKTLKLDDFNPQFEEEREDLDFCNRVKERLVFLAFNIDNEKYLEIEEEFKEKFQEWKVRKCKKISLKFPEIDSKIVKDDNRNFIIHETKTIYYIGEWYDLRNYILVEWLQNHIINVKKQLQFLQDMLLNSAFDIITDFENKGKVVPEEIKRRFNFKKQIPLTIHIDKDTLSVELDDQVNGEILQSVEETEKKEIREIVDIIPDVTTEDEEFIRSIINFSYDKDEQIDANTTAKIKTLMQIRDRYLMSDISDEGRFLRAGDDEILVRSAQNGLLYFDLYSWDRLSRPNVQLALYTNSTISFFSSQDNLVDYTKPLNKFGVLRMPEDYIFEDYNLDKNTIEKGKWHFVFIVNENTKVAQNYKDIMDLDEFNNYG